MSNDTFVVYSYSRGSDGALELVDRRMFQTKEEAERFFDEKMEEIISGKEDGATSLELNRELYSEDEWFMSDSVNERRYSRQSDFAAS